MQNYICFSIKSVSHVLVVIRSLLFMQQCGKKTTLKTHIKHPRTWVTEKNNAKRHFECKQSGRKWVLLAKMCNATGSYFSESKLPTTRLDCVHRNKDNNIQMAVS